MKNVNLIKLFIAITMLPFAANAAVTVPASAEAERSIESFGAPTKEPNFEEAEVKTPLDTNIVSSPAEQEYRFVLNDIIVEGSTNYDKSNFKSVYQEYVGTEIDFQTVLKIAGDIANKYRNDGYILSSATIPDQDISSGIVRIRVVEAYLDEVTVVGEYKKNTVVSEIIDRIASMTPLNLNNIEKYVLLLNDVPGVKAQIVLKPRDKKNKNENSIGLVVLLDHDPYRNTASFDNDGSGYTGPWQLSLQTGANSAIVKYHEATLSAYVALPLRELRYIQGSYTVPLTAEGTTSTLTASFTDSEPGYHLQRSHVVSEAIDVKFSVAHPIIRSRKMNWSLAADIALKRSQTDILKSLLSHDKLTIFSISQSFNNIDSWNGANIANLTIAQGMNILGARETGAQFLSRSRGHSDFTRVSGTAARLQRLNDDFNMYFAATGQYAFTTLLSSQEFGLGGRQFGKAYDNSEITGDHGLGGTVELRYNKVPEFYGIISEAFAFYDIGKVWDIRRKSTNGRAAISSTGVGLRFSDNADLNGMFTIAQPLTRKVGAPTYGNPKSTRYFIKVNYSF